MFSFSPFSRFIPNFHLPKTLSSSLILHMNPSNSPNDSRENRPMITDELMESAFKALMWLYNRRNEGMEERESSDSDKESIDADQKRRRTEESIDAQRRRQWAEEDARRQKERDYEAARRLAFNLHSDYSLEDVEKQENNDDDKEEDKSDFQKAKEAIKKRRQEISTTTDMEIDLMIIPRKAPTLMDLTARLLAQNIEAIESLRLVPDQLKTKLSNLVSGLGKVDTRFMQLLIEDSPNEICARNCVDIQENDLIKILCDCDRVSLKVLILDLCGRAMTENTISEFLKCAPNGFPSLTKLSLQGAFCLTDRALKWISKSSPLLQFINLSDCSLLTFDAVKILAAKFRSTLRGLNIGGCQGIKRSADFSSSLSKFEKLNSQLQDSTALMILLFKRSLCPIAPIARISLIYLSLLASNDVTDDCIWQIGRYCKKLEALDISNLDQLTDKSLEYITLGCKSLNAVKLSSNRFSDLGIAAFLKVLGGSLKELCLNKVRDVGPDTAISLANVCKSLQFLDLSWCRKLTEEDLRRILSGCSSLRSLKLFGWTQVEDRFLEELSRSHVHIIGLKMTSLYAHLDDFYPILGANFF